jgi:uncharacterized phage protein (TIGR01671 family)
MREILFKAKRINNGEWVEGFYVNYKNVIHYILVYDGNGFMWYEIEKETLCQYTGLTDKNGNKIWENDVVEFEDTGEEGYEYKEGYDFINRARVEFAEARWSLTDFLDTNSAVVDEMYNQVEFMDLWQYCEVIGNIFDNPELKGSEENAVD